MNTLRDKDHAADRKQIIDGLGVTYTATFQPKPQASEKHPQLHWLITLSKGKQTLSVPYSQGIGHVVGYKHRVIRTLYDEEQHRQFVKTCETGKLYKSAQSAGCDISTAKQPAPELEAVLYCLVMDASVLNCSSYEEWAGEYGYDEDSRKGEAVYRQCLEQSLSLRRLIGDKAIEALREAYQDY